MIAELNRRKTKNHRRFSLGVQISQVTALKHVITISIHFSLKEPVERWNPLMKRND
jgi:hypothetical protein